MKFFIIPNHDGCTIACSNNNPHFSQIQEKVASERINYTYMNKTGIYLSSFALSKYELEEWRRFK